MISLLGSLLNLKGLEESRYTLLGSQGPFEIRLYQRTTAARVFVPGNFHDSFQEGKRLLMEYLTGGNLRLEKVPHSQIFFQTPRITHWEIGVMLNFTRVNSEIPRPVNRLIRLEEIPPVKMAILRCNRITSKEIFLQKEEELLNWINLRSYQHSNLCRLLHYDNGIPLPFLREKELSVQIM